MTTAVTYEELAVAIANWVHKHIRTESPDDRPADRVIVDNACESGPQIATGVLARLGLLEALDDQNRRYRFTVPPDRFRQVVKIRQEQGTGYETLVLAAICLLEIDTAADDLRELLTQLGVLHPIDASGGLRWRSEKLHYDSLYERWPDLISDTSKRP